MTPALGLVAIAVVCLLIGTSVGATGYGGFLIPVALVAAVGFSATVAVYHSLLGAVIPTVLAAVLYLRSPTHRPRWDLVGWLSVGTVPGVGVGRWLTATVDSTAMTVVLGLVVVAAGGLVLVQTRRAGRGDGPATDERSDPPRPRIGVVATAVACVVAGCAGGLTTVLAGVGGPLVTVPALLIIGVPVTAAVGSAMINSLVGIALTLATMIGRLPLEASVLVVITVAMATGMVAGVRLHHRLSTKWLVIPVGIISLVTGAWIAIAAVG